MRLLLNKIVKFLSGVVFFVLLVFLCYLSFSPTPVAHSPEAINRKVKALHETAAVWVPHLGIDKGKVRQQHLPLFEKVEEGQMLDENESHQYRLLYQSLLLEHQSFFSHFDSQLSAITNLGMDQQNNVGGHGIEGHHDHHDQSSRNNFAEIERSYAVLHEKSFQKSPWFSFARVKNAIFIYKNLNDILFHLATVPHTKSIAYHAVSGSTHEQQGFEFMLQHFKAAQFVPVNSDLYKQQVGMSLVEYEKLVSLSEKLVHQHLSEFELKLVGSWGGWQSLTPPVSDRVNE